MSLEEDFAMPKFSAFLFASLFAAGLCVLLLVLVVASPPILAQSLPNAPDAPGSIAGTVTAEGGAPLAGIDVDIYQLLPYGGWSPVRAYVTDAQGAYEALALAAGMYRVGFSDPANQYGPSFYAGALTVGGATSIAVAGVDVTGIDAVLQPAGAVTGLYSDARPLLSTFAYIAALVREADEWRPTTQRLILETGSYSLTGLAPGVYRICAYDWYQDPLPHPSVCYDDIVSSPDYAQAVTVTGAVTTTGIDLNAGVEGDGAAIGGLVRGAGNAPLANIEVWFESWSQPPTGFISPTTTSSSGRYEVRGLAPGSYTLRFVDAGTGIHQTQYYSGVTSSPAATIVRVERFEERLDVDVTLALGGILSGTVRVLGERPSYAMIYAEPRESIDPAIPLYAIADYQSGAYRFLGLPPARYRLMVNASLNGHMFSGVYNGPAADEDGYVTVAPGAILEGLDVNLGTGVYDGEISGAVTGDGVPLSGIAVSAYSFEKNLVVTVPTDAQGRYRIGGLQSGIYTVGFSDPAGIYATQHYSGSLNLARAQFLFLEFVGQIANINASLARAGSLSGRVILDDGVPGTFHTIQLYYVRPHSDGFELIDLERVVNTDSSGAFVVQGLLPAMYRVCAETRPYISYQGGCYGGPLLVHEPGMSQDVPVRVGEETTDIDIYLVTMLPEHSYLPAVARQ